MALPDRARAPESESPGRDGPGFARGALGGPKPDQTRPFGTVCQ